MPGFEPVFGKSGSGAEALAIGARLPPFSLKGTDGRKHGSDELFSGKNALVVIFSCNHCPYVKAYEDRIVAVQADYARKGVQIVAINPNDERTFPEDSFEKMVLRARQKKFNFPYLRDETQEVARAFGAQKTPHVFVFGPDRKLSYRGRIDDNWEDSGRVMTRYLRNALDDILAWRKVAQPEAETIGCSIKWKGPQAGRG